MSDSPRSERVETRFSTPVSELDDHRFQPTSLPTNAPLPSRRGTLASIINERPDLLTVDDPLFRLGPISRDFEQAIVDDDRSANGSVSGHARGRRPSVVPISPMERRGTFRRARQPEDKPNRSRNSSASSRSASPPNSVDAFADPRRRERANTVNSAVESLAELGLHRTVSGGTLARRPAYSECKSADNREGGASRLSCRSSVADDICFPQTEENSKTYFIDYEELEEFVAESQNETPVGLGYGQDPEETSEPKVFSDLRPGIGGESIKNIATAESAVSDKLDEKLTDSQKEVLQNSMPGERRSSSAPAPVPFNRWTFFSSNQDDMVYASDLGGLLGPGETFRDLFELPEDGGVWWLDMLNPSEEEINVICKAFGVHPLTREDITERESREKVELFRSYYFVCFRSFWQIDQEDEDFLEPVNVYMVVFREGLLTFTFNQNPHASNVRKRIMRLRDYVNLSADWICYALMYDNSALIP